MENNQYGLTEQETKTYSMLSKIIIILGTLSWFFIPYQLIVGNEPEWLFYSAVSLFTAWIMLLALGALQRTKILALEYATLGRYKLNFKDYLVAVVLVLTSVMLFNMQHYIYSAIIFVCGFINHHYKSIAYKVAKEATTNVIVKLMKQTGAASLIDLADKLNQTDNVDESNVKDYGLPDFDVSTPMPKVKPPLEDCKLEQEENEDLSVDTKDKK